MVGRAVGIGEGIWVGIDDGMGVGIEVGVAVGAMVGGSTIDSSSPSFMMASRVWQVPTLAQPSET